MSAFQRLGSREVYRNPWLAVEVHEIVHPSGAPGEHLLVVTPPCAGVVVADGGDLLFTRQARFGAGAEVLEIVKGGAEGRESLLECARRELREELGVVAAHWKPLGMLFEIPSIISAPIEIFLAHGVEHVDHELEDVESIELVRVPEASAVRAAVAGEINDAVTVAALLRYGVTRGIIQLSTAPARPFS